MPRRMGGYVFNRVRLDTRYRHFGSGTPADVRPRVGKECWWSEGHVRVISLSVDNRSGNRNREEETDEPTWEQVERAFQSLDARRHTMLTLEADEEDHGLIVGGGGGLYVVTVHRYPEIFTLTSAETDAGEAVRLTIGGQEGIFAKNLCVGVDQALLAMRRYFETCELERSMRWVAE